MSNVSKFPSNLRRTSKIFLTLNDEVMKERGYTQG